MAAGRETPGTAADTERLKRYWTDGPGGAKIRWGVPGDFDRCVAEVTKYMPANAKGYCANLHRRATGANPGHAPGVEQAEYQAKHGGH